MVPNTASRMTVMSNFFFSVFFFCLLVIIYPPRVPYSKTLDFRIPVGIKVRMMMRMPKEMQSL